MSVSVSCHRFAGLCALGLVLALAQPVLSRPALAQTTPSTSAATAASVPGCNPNVMEAGQASAEASVAVSRAAIDEAFPQPPSVLQTGCFNQAAGVAASVGGNTFSGDFTAGVQPVVGSALKSIYANFDGFLGEFFGSEAGGAISGFLGKAFGLDSAEVQSSYDCSGLDDVVNALMERGVGNNRIPTFNDLADDKLPSWASKAVKKSLESSIKKGVFANARNAADALPRPQVKSYSRTGGVCDALKDIAGGKNVCKKR